MYLISDEVIIDKVCKLSARTVYKREKRRVPDRRVLLPHDTLYKEKKRRTCPWEQQ